MDRKIFLTLATFALLLSALYLVFSIIAPFLRALAWAAVIGIMTFPLYRRLRARLHGRNLLAASIMTPAVTLTLVLPMMVLIFFLTLEVAEIHRLLANGSMAGTPDIATRLKGLPVVAPLLEWIAPYLVKFDFQLNHALSLTSEKAMTFLLAYSAEVLKNFIAFAIKLALVVIALFCLYRGGEEFLARFWSVVPIGEENKERLIATVKNVLTAVIYGIFLTSALQGILGGIGFWFCGLPSPVLSGMLMAIAALFPVGTALFWVPGAIYLFFQGEVLKGVLLLAWGILVVSSVDNVLRPLFISGRARIPLLAVILGVLGGLAAFGFIGVIAGPLVLALFLSLFDIYRAEISPESRPGTE